MSINKIANTTPTYTNNMSYAFAMLTEKKTLQSKYSNHTLTARILCISSFFLYYSYASAVLCNLAVMSRTSAIIAAYISYSIPTGDICGHSCFILYACFNRLSLFSSSSHICSLLISSRFPHNAQFPPCRLHSIPCAIIICMHISCTRTFTIIAHMVENERKKCSAFLPKNHSAIKEFVYLQNHFYLFFTIALTFRWHHFLQYIYHVL